MRGKAACERAFGALRSLLFEQLPGYTGVDVADRGADPEADAVLTMAQMERLIDLVPALAVFGGVGAAILPG